jgi:hypothetical protein
MKYMFFPGSNITCFIPICDLLTDSPSCIYESVNVMPPPYWQYVTVKLCSHHSHFRSGTLLLNLEKRMPSKYKSDMSLMRECASWMLMNSYTLTHT